MDSAKPENIGIPLNCLGLPISYLASVPSGEMDIIVKRELARQQQLIRMMGIDGRVEDICETFYLSLVNQLQRPRECNGCNGFDVDRRCYHPHIPPKRKYS